MVSAMLGKHREADEGGPGRGRWALQGGSPGKLPVFSLLFRVP